MIDAKATNPKDAIGTTKLDLSLVPSTAIAYLATSFTEGATKYGRFNWRIAGVRASIYAGALQRHFAKWWNGEDADPKTRVKHLSSVMACAAILLDAELCGKLTDDRPPAAPVGDLIDSLEATVAHLKKINAAANPKQYTIADTADGLFDPPPVPASMASTLAHHAEVAPMPAPVEEPVFTDGWIKWDGGPRPVPPTTHVLVRMRDGFESTYYSEAGRLIWRHGLGHGDIVAYKVVANA